MQRTSTFPPGPRALPFFGNMLDFRRDQLEYLQRMQRTYGDMVTIHMGKGPVVLLFRPEYVRYVLTENPRNFTSLQSNGDLKETLGEGLLTIDGEAHRQQRRLVQPAFHRKRVESYAETMVRYTFEMLKRWHGGEEKDMAHEMQKLTLRIVAKSLFNLELASQISDLGQQFTAMMENRRSMLARLLKVYIDAPFTAYGKRMAARHKVDALIYRLIAERRAEGGDAGDVVSMLLAAEDEGNQLTEMQVRDHVMTLMAAGHETTANALTWTFYLLAQNPAVCEKLLSELQTVLAGRAPTLSDLPNLPYTEWVLKESMRLYPPAWIIGRHALERFELGGYTFPKGTTFLMSQWLIQRHPEFWENPTEFYPQRWDPMAGEKVPQWAYFPFGGGPRICIGMPFAQLEAKLLLATMLQHFRPQLAPGFEVELQPLVTLRPRRGMRVVLEEMRLAVEEDVVVGA
ncbi:MAG: cytochrome P450 [Ktedonobacteraceae bacterium]